MKNKKKETLTKDHLNEVRILISALCTLCIVLKLRRTLICHIHIVCRKTNCFLDHFEFRIVIVIHISGNTPRALPVKV